MKRITAFFIALIFLYNTSAQDYQVIRSDRTVFYDFYLDTNNSFNSIKIDSVKVVNEDSVFYPIPTIYEMSRDCYEPFGPSLLGSKIVIQANGDNLLFNKNEDTIKICAKAKLGESWIINLPRQNVPIKATVIDHKVENFLELTDSVKTIQFQAVDEADSAVLEIVGLTIKLSKNYGLIQGIDFREFPKHSWRNNFSFKQLQLLGLTNPARGVQNFTWFDVYDFQVGDEFHGKNCTSCLYNSCTEYIQTIEKREDFYSDEGQLEKIVYTINNEYSSYNRTDSSTRYGIDTLKKTIQQDQYLNFDVLPGHTYQRPYGNRTEYTQYRMLPYKNTVAKVIPINHYDHICFNDSCWTKEYCVIDGSEPFHYYGKGLGGPYYYDDTDWTGCVFTRNLVYYKKGDKSWGTPVIITSIEDLNINKPVLKIYPNPVQNRFTVTTNQKYLPAQLKIIDLSGKTVLDEKVSSTSKTIQINNLVEGLYLATLYNEDYVFPAQKLLVNR